MPNLPNELIEAIIEALLDGTRAPDEFPKEKLPYLSTTALISHRWRQATNARRFAFVKLTCMIPRVFDGVARISRFAELIRSSLDIAHIIRKLSLDFDAATFEEARFPCLRTREERDSRARIKSDLIMILNSIFLDDNYEGPCYSLTLGMSHLSDKSISWKLMDKEIVDAVMYFCMRPRLSSLELLDMRKVPRAFYSSSNLTKLDVTNVSFDAQILPHLDRPFQRLSFLAFDTGSNFVEALRSLSEPPPSLAEIELLFTVNGDSASAYRCIQFLCTTLNTLSLQFYCADPNQLPSSSLQDSFSHLTELSLVFKFYMAALPDIDLPNDFPNPLKCVLLFLPSNRIQQLNIGIDVTVASFEDDYDCNSEFMPDCLDELYDQLSDTPLADYLLSAAPLLPHSINQEPHVNIVLNLDLRKVMSEEDLSDDKDFDIWRNSDAIVLPDHVCQKYYEYLYQKYSRLCRIKGVTFSIRLLPEVRAWGADV